MAAIPITWIVFGAILVLFGVILLWLFYGGSNRNSPHESGSGSRGRW